MKRQFRQRSAPNYRTSSVPRLFLNFIPLTLSSETFIGELLPFESSEQLEVLRSQYAKTHVLLRQGHEIACVPLLPDAPRIGEQTTFHVGQRASVVRKLVQEALIRTLAKSEFRLKGFYPVSFVARGRSRDLLARAAGDAASTLACLHVYPQYTLDARALHSRGEPRFGILVGVRVRYEIDANVAKLIAKGMDVRGRYVLTEEDRSKHDIRLDPIARRQLAGRVDALNGDQLILGDTHRFTQLPAERAWLEARRENFADIVRLSGVVNVEGVLNQLDREVSALVGAKGHYQKVVEIAEWLKRRGPLMLADGLFCTADTPPRLEQGMDGGSYRHFPSPTFVFDPAGTKAGRFLDRGLDEFGPFDAESFAPKRPHIAVVTPKEFQGDVEVFLRKFKQGVPDASTFTRGFVRKYRLVDCTFHIEPFGTGPREAASYRQACLDVLQRDPKPDLAFVITKEEHKELDGHDDPYLVAKSIFMSQGVPVQGIAIETIRVPPHLQKGLPHKLNGIAMACYAKLGGIPFVINAPQKLEQELVIGIGSASISRGRSARIERVVGITTVFTADGNYLLYNTSREVPYDEYPGELLATLRDAVNRVRSRNGWQPGDAVRLVFHVFKPLKNIEAQAVKRLVGELVDDFNVEFAFLHVSEHHEWKLFDLDSIGAPDGQVADPQLWGKRKGEYVPRRGYAVPLSRSEILLTTVGPKGLVTPLQGAPRPLLLRLHRESTFQDLEYLAEQVYRFTSLSWRSLFPTSRPVTILYSDLIASLLGRLRNVPNWNPDALSTMLRTSRWFL